MFLRTLTMLLASATLIQSSIAGYALSDDYSGNHFFNGFHFFTDTDPTDGFVKYHDFDAAVSQSLIGMVSRENNSIYLGVDTNTTLTAGAKPGRASVRLQSVKTFNHGLFIADILHIPFACGAWPAMWLLGQQTWPQGGEIDIVEGVNAANNNSMTLHTNAGCSIQSTGYSGTASTTNCDVKDPKQPENAGCGISSPDTISFGADFNANRGGVYATEWTSQAIKIWFFPRAKIPQDIESGTPNPSGWGQPTAQFAGSCNIDQHFQNHNLIFNTAFCGQWAGRVWKDSSCAAKAPTCEEFVAKNPKEMLEAYWLIQSVRVYEDKPATKVVRGVDWRKMFADAEERRGV